MAFIPTRLHPVSRNPVSGAVLWLYTSEDDTVDTIIQDAYFTAQGTGISVGDGIVVIGSDSISSLRVLAVDGGTGDVSTIGGSVTLESIILDPINNPILPDIGGTVQPVNLLQELERIHQRINTKIQSGQSIGDGTDVFVGGGVTGPGKTVNFRRLEAGTGIDIQVIDDTIVITNTGGGGTPPPTDEFGGSLATGTGLDGGFDTRGEFPEARYGGAFAPWAIRAASIATAGNSNALLNEVFNIVPGRFNLNINKFTPAVYDSTLANTTVQFTRTSTNFGGNLNTGATIPWNFNLFETPRDFDPTDGDSYTILVDRNNGRCFEFFQSDIVNGRLNAGRGEIIQNGLGAGASGDPANIFTKQNGSQNSRACGIHHATTIALRSEVDTGRIPHCIPINYPNPSQFEFEAPATKGAGGTGGAPGRGFMGLRIVWDGLTDNDIDSWLLTRPAATRPTLRIIANCLREFGGIAADNAGNAANGRGATQLEHTLTGKWEELGVTRDNSLTALHSLLEPNQGKARALAVPNRSSLGAVACYPGVPYPQGHPCNP